MSMPVIEASSTTRTQAINDLLESIALQETALSHILNAEGEKIQAVVAMECVCPNDLLAVNESVCCTLNTAKDFEQVLYDKLNTLLAQ